MGNDAFFRRWQLAAYVDVPGREYTWIDGNGNVTPVEDARFLFLRAMSAKRPYLMLMNNRYDDAAAIEPYFQRSLFYAVFPSFFMGHQAMNEVAYFSNPSWYNRDRHLFKKYLPLIRAVDEAGWEPVPHATIAPAEVRIERYGSGERGTMYLSVHNPTAAEVEATVTLDRDALKLGAAQVRVRERIQDVDVPLDGSVLKLRLAAGDVRDAGDRRQVNCYQPLYAPAFAGCCGAG